MVQVYNGLAATHLPNPFQIIDVLCCEISKAPNF